jgi:uncharacterized protein YxeA
MRKIIFIVLILIVAGVVGFFTWNEFQIPGVNYVTDYTASMSTNQLRILRFYAAEVDIEAYEQELEKITTMTEYTEEQKAEAAVRSGSPVLIPTFNIGINEIAGGVQIAGFIETSTAPNQTERRFRLGNVSLETDITAGELIIDDISVFTHNNGDTPLTKIHSDTQSAFDITDASIFHINMTDGQAGSITMQFRYSVVADTLFTRTVLEEQILRLNITVNTNAAGIVEAEFDIEPFSNLEDFLNAE